MYVVLIHHDKRILHFLRSATGTHPWHDFVAAVAHYLLVSPRSFCPLAQNEIEHSLGLGLVTEAPSVIFLLLHFSQTTLRRQLTCIFGLLEMQRIAPAAPSSGRDWIREKRPVLQNEWHMFRST